MKKITTKIIIPIFAISLLSGCGGNGASTTQEEFTVSFYDNTELYTTQVVKNGECATEPEKPTKSDNEFKYWCTDSTLTKEYDFSTPVTKDFSLYALFNPVAPFLDYSDKYHPVSSPFIVEQNFFIGDQDIDIVLTADEIEINANIDAKQVRLEGGFEDLEVTGVDSKDNVITIHTKGVVKSQDSYVVFSKSTNSEHIYLTVPFKINEKLVPSVSIDYSSVNIDLDKDAIYFSIESEYQTLKHDEKMTAIQYLEKVNDGTFNYFRVNESVDYQMNIVKIHDDFRGFDVKIDFSKDIDEAMLNQIARDVHLFISEEAFEDGEKHEFPLDFLSQKITSKILVTPMKVNTYSGTYRIHVNGAKFSSDFIKSFEKLLVDPNNKNLFLTIPEADVIVRSINLTNDYEIHGKIDIYSESELTDATVSLNPITINEETVEPLSKLFTNEPVSISPILAKVNIGYDPSKAGTIEQDAGSNYQGIKSYIEYLSAYEDTTIDDLIFIGSTIGKIAYGAYSNDYAKIGEALGKAFGIDAIRDPTSLMLDRLQGLMDKLEEIENRIQDLSEKIEDLKRELEAIGQLNILDNFLNAYSIWTNFKSNYYSPLIDEIRDYTLSYSRYFYDFAMSSHPNSEGNVAKIDIYYDKTGKVVFPADNYIYSVDGKVIDKSKTKTIVFPELIHTLAGIRHASGRAYDGIEDDIIVDLMSRHQYKDEEISDIMQTLIFNAMKNQFVTTQKISDFANRFENFCDALTASDIISSVSISPLECFSIMLRTIFNFGFEIEPDLNLVAIKFRTVFYSARKIFEFVKFIDTGDIDIGRYESIVKNVESELSSTRFYRSNDEKGNVYSYVTDCYVRAATTSYGIQFSQDYYKNTTTKIVGGDVLNPDATNLSEFTSITENDVSMMKLKVKVYNVIRGTNYSFKGYLAKIGIIPEELYATTLGVLTKIDGIVEGSDTYGLSVPKNLDELHFSDPYTDPTVIKEEGNIEDFARNGSFIYALKGNWISFDDEKSYEMVTAFVGSHMRDAYGQFYNNPSVGVFGNCDVGVLYDAGTRDGFIAWANYVVFIPVQ